MYSKKSIMKMGVLVYKTKLAFGIQNVEEYKYFLVIQNAVKVRSDLPLNLFVRTTVFKWLL